MTEITKLVNYLCFFMIAVPVQKELIIANIHTSNIWNKTIPVAFKKWEHKS